MATKKKTDGSTGIGKNASSTPSKIEAPSATDVQLKTLEQGIRLFRESRFGDAKALFEQVLTGPQRDMAHTARLHIQVCERRMSKPRLELQTAEEHYNYGVERLNARDLEIARKHLEVALALSPDAEHILYAAAASEALSGDLSRAYENLKRAIEINPRNRVAARQDADFSGLAHHPLFQPLLFPERPSPF